MERLSEMAALLGISAEQLYSQFQSVGNAGNWVYFCGQTTYWGSRHVRNIYRLPQTVELAPRMLFDRVHPGDKDIVRQAFDRLAQGAPFHAVHRILADDEIRWVEQDGRLYRANLGTYLVGSVRDITQVKREELRLAERHDDLAAITAYLAETTDTTDLQAIAASVERVLRMRLDALMIGVFARQGERVARIAPHDMEYMQAFSFQRIEDFGGYQAAITGHRQVWSVEAYPGALGREVLQTLGRKSVIALPIRHDGATIGALSLAIRRPGELLPEEEAFCQTICGYLSNQLNSTLQYQQMKERLERQNHLQADYEAVFSESVDDIAIIDAEGRICQINTAFAESLGVTPQTLVGTALADLIHPDDRVYALCAVRGLAPGAAVRDLYCRVASGGRTLQLACNLKRMQNRGILMIARDVTQQRDSAAAEHEEKTEQIERAANELVADMSHSFKTPLNVIISSLNLLRTKLQMENADGFAKDYARFLDYADASSYRLLRLITNLVDLGRAELGMLQFCRRRYDLTEYLRQAVQIARPYLEPYGAELRLDSVQNGPAWVFLDAEYLTRILFNLLAGAVQRMPRGGRISVSARLRGGQAELAVEDQGEPVAPETLAQMLGRARTQSSMANSRYGGNLGMYVVRVLAELRGGTVAAEERTEKGNCFVCTLPCDGDGEDPADGVLNWEFLRAQAKMELSYLKE